MDILDDIEVSKLSTKVFVFKVNYSFKCSFMCDWFGTVLLL